MMIQWIKKNQLELYLYLFLPIVFITIILAWGIYYLDHQSQLDKNRTNAEHHVQIQVKTLELTFRQILADLRFLAQQQGLQNYLQHPFDHNQKALSNDYQVFSRQKKIYDQIRFLDETGQEKVRINYNKGDVKTVVKDKLQNKGKRYYFMDAFKLDKGQIFISPFDLNIERGQIEQPIKPMIRFGMPVFDQNGNKRGIILLNYLGEDLLKRFRRSAEDISGSMFLLNQNGYSLSSENIEKDWGFMYPDRKDLTFSVQEPVIWKKVSSSLSGQFQMKNELITYNTVSPLFSGIVSSSGSAEAYSASNKQLSSHDYFWKIVSILNDSQQSLRSHNLLPAISVFSGLIILISFLGTWALSRSRSHLSMTVDMLATKLDELEKTRDQLLQSEKMASLGRMVAGFAHEVNTPVGIAVGATSQIEHCVAKLNQLMTQDEVEEEDLMLEMDTLNEATRLILSNLNRAANLVISFKRSSVDQTSNQERTFYLCETVEDVLNALKNKLKHSSIKIEIECDKKLKIKSRPGLYEQLLTNLIMNSYIHAYDNGAQAGRIQINIDIISDTLHINYDDDGIGMNSETLDKIFEPFFTTDRISGTGLGMYLCYSIVTSELNGSISCHSKLGQGCHFDILLPVIKLDNK
ncbi:MAG: sensor histidine kinase [Gammaproteobacteria bacterium]|nr:sensor histidine kinase [Gammaproteobacteria bacterium]